MSLKQTLITDYFKPITDLHNSRVRFIRNSRSFHKLSPVQQYHFIIHHFESIFALFSFAIKSNIKHIQTMCFKYLLENEFCFINYMNLTGNKFSLGALNPYPFHKPDNFGEYYWNHAVAIRQNGFKTSEKIFNFKCVYKIIHNIDIGIIASNTNSKQIHSFVNSTQSIFENTKLQSAYRLNIFKCGSPYTPRGSTIYHYNEFGYVHRCVRRHNDVNRRKWPLQLEPHDIITIKVNIVKKIIIFFYNGILIHRFNILHKDLRNIYFYPIISIPIKPDETYDFEMSTF
eukprot:329035_1